MIPDRKPIDATAFALTALLCSLWGLQQVIIKLAALDRSEISLKRWYKPSQSVHRWRISEEAPINPFRHAGESGRPGFYSGSPQDDTL
jgi:hypothetical protein